MRGFSLRYSILAARLDQLWLPAAFWLLFALIAIFFTEHSRLVWVARGYLGCVLPLTAGVMAAYAVLDDPAIELRFSTPIPAWTTLLERLGFPLAASAFCAGAFQLLLIALPGGGPAVGDWLSAQLAWAIPTLALMAIGCVASLAGNSVTAGALTAGLIWLVELIARGWMAGDAWAQYILLFMGSLMPDHPALRANQGTLLALCVVCFLACWLLLRRQERYL